MVEYQQDFGDDRDTRDGGHAKPHRMQVLSGLRYNAYPGNTVSPVLSGMGSHDFDKSRSWAATTSRGPARPSTPAVTGELIEAAARCSAEFRSAGLPMARLASLLRDEASWREENRRDSSHSPDALLTLACRIEAAARGIESLSGKEASCGSGATGEALPVLGLNGLLKTIGRADVRDAMKSAVSGLLGETRRCAEASGLSAAISAAQRAGGREASR